MVSAAASPNPVPTLQPSRLALATGRASVGTRRPSAHPPTNGLTHRSGHDELTPLRQRLTSHPRQHQFPHPAVWRPVLQEQRPIPRNIFDTRLAGVASMTSRGAVNNGLINAGSRSNTSRDPPVAALMPGQDSYLPFRLLRGAHRGSLVKGGRGHREATASALEAPVGCTAQLSRPQRNRA